MVLSQNQTIILFLAIFLSTKLTVSASFANGEDYEEPCHEREKEALLSFEQDLIDPSNRLLSWVAKEDCCKWAGIGCCLGLPNNVTGHVTELRLSNAGNHDDHTPLKGKLNPSLLSLKHLSYLDLSNNDFAGIQIPSFIGSLVGLRHLNLTETGFSGMIPHQLGNLSSLRHLGLRSLDGFMYARNLRWISGLYSLEHLDMSGVNLGEVSDWFLTFNRLSSLSELRLSSCGLDYIQRPSSVNLTSLSVLDLSFNGFEYSLLNWIFKLTSLFHLDLNRNNFIGPFPNISWSSTSLRSLDVSNNYLNSTIPDSLYGSNLENLNLGSNEFDGVLSSAIENLTSIVTLDLSHNALEGKIPSAVGNLCSLEAIFLAGNKYSGRVSEVFQILSSGCVSDHLKSLDLAKNSFSGQITDQILEFKNLSYLSLSYNMISGPIPASLEKLSKLRSLHLSGNKLNGSLPEKLGSLSNLEELVIFDNLFEGVVSEVHFANLTNLNGFFASGNALILRVDKDWIPPFRLVFLELGSWKLGPLFPMWLHSQMDDLITIDLSNTGISDAIPGWFWNLSSQFMKMNLSHNQLFGEIPRLLNVSRESRIYLGFNNLTGLLPRISSTITVMDLSNNFFSGELSGLLCHPIYGVQSSMKVLLLGANLLSGKIPNCWMYWTSLNWIDLANNNLTGEIPSSMGSLKDLMSLHLHNNKLSGKLPRSLQNCSLLIILDLGLNKLVGSIPKWIGGNLLRLRILILNSNKFSGNIPAEICRLHRLQILIVADNNLFGSIPSCFDNINAMATKQDTYPSIQYAISDGLTESVSIMIKRREGEYNTILNLVTCLDLSNNNFSNEIPKQLTSLQGLISMNLSGNHLKGNIPDNIGNMTWVESLDLSRNQLSGKIPLGISNLHFLSNLNVSSNNLFGEIPRSTQLQSMDDSSFLGNQLCGPPLLKNCTAGEKKTPEPQDEDAGEEEVEYWFRLGIAVGFAVGFLVIICPLAFCRVWRHAYFWFLQHMWYKISDCIFNFRYMVINNFIRTHSI